MSQQNLGVEAYAGKMAIELGKLGDPVVLSYPEDATDGPEVVQERVVLTTIGKGREGLEFTVNARTMAVPVVSPNENDYYGQAKTTHFAFNTLIGVAKRLGITPLQLTKRIDAGDANTALPEEN